MTRFVRTGGARTRTGDLYDQIKSAEVKPIPGDPKRKKANLGSWKVKQRSPRDTAVWLKEMVVVLWDTVDGAGNKITKVSFNAKVNGSGWKTTGSNKPVWGVTFFSSNPNAGWIEKFRFPGRLIFPCRGESQRLYREEFDEDLFDDAKLVHFYIRDGKTKECV